jgi:hypothetical protein
MAICRLCTILGKKLLCNLDAPDIWWNPGPKERLSLICGICHSIHLKEKIKGNSTFF